MRAPHFRAFIFDPSFVSFYLNNNKLKLLKSLIPRNVSEHETSRIVMKSNATPVSDSTFGIRTDPGQSFIQIRNSDTPRYPECLMDRLILTHDVHYTRESHEPICTLYMVLSMWSSYPHCPLSARNMSL